MKHDREFWTRHVESWRASGLTQQMYCRRHRLTKGTLSYWVSALSGQRPRNRIWWKFGCAPIKEQRPSSPIELIVGGRYVLRLVVRHGAAHMRDVLSVSGVSPMIRLEVKEARVFVRPGATDMRKQIQRPGSDHRASHGIQRLRAGAICVLPTAIDGS